MSIFQIISMALAGWFLLGFIAFRIQVFRTKGIKTPAGHEFQTVLSDYGRHYQKRYGNVPPASHGGGYWERRKVQVPEKHYNPRDGLMWVLFKAWWIPVMIITGIWFLLFKGFLFVKRTVVSTISAIHRFLTSDGFNTSPVVNKIFGLK